jgi:hypothetical protein
VRQVEQFQQEESVDNEDYSSEDRTDAPCEEGFVASGQAYEAECADLNCCGKDSAHEECVLFRGTAERERHRPAGESDKREECQDRSRHRFHLSAAFFAFPSLVVGFLGGGELTVHAVEGSSAADEDTGDEECG